jgi:hypothetical protein
MKYSQQIIDLSREMFYSMDTIESALDTFTRFGHGAQAEQLLRMCAQGDAAKGGGTRCLDSAIQMLRDERKRKQEVKDTQRRAMEQIQSIEPRNRAERRALKFKKRSIR